MPYLKASVKAILLWIIANVKGTAGGYVFFLCVYVLKRCSFYFVVCCSLLSGAAVALEVEWVVQ